MALDQLKELRTKTVEYLDNNVTCTISEIRPDTPTTLNPNEGFSFDVSARNLGAPNGVDLKNIIYYITVNNESRVKLKVPPAATGNCYSSLSSAIDFYKGTVPAPTPLAPDTPASPNERRSYYLVPASSSLRKLTVGNADTISNLKGRAIAIGDIEIRFKIYADVDLDYLFPNAQDSALVSRPGVVT